MFTVKAGGTKGQAITAELIRQHQKEDWRSRSAIAEAAGCTVGRVGESIRYLAGTEGVDGHEAAVWHVATAEQGKRARKAVLAVSSMTRKCSTPSRPLSGRRSELERQVTSAYGDEVLAAEAAFVAAQDDLTPAGAYRMASELVSEGHQVPADVLLVANEYAKKAKRKRLAQPEA